MVAAASTPGTPAGPPVPAPPSAPAPDRAVAREARRTDRGIVRHESVHAERWQAGGSVKVIREVDVGSARVTGSLVVGGGLSADEFRSRGTLEVQGALRVRGVFFARGSFHGAAEVRAGDLTLEGTARVDGAISVERAFTLKGTLDAPSVVAGLLEADGMLRVPGEIRGLSVRAGLRPRSALGRVTAREVRLSGHIPNLVDKAFFREERVTVERIEADTVVLAGVDVAFVRAKEVALGRDCHVTAIEGTIVRRHASSTVGPESKSPPPYGLRR
jgi:cytoskeletal protein CcmA (bactofilin family)